MKSAPHIWIGSMRVRVPGASKEAGHALAQSLREQLGHLPAGGRTGHIGALRLRISGSPGMEPGAISQAIATRISINLTSKKSDA
jgi:hypothetical protein